MTNQEYIAQLKTIFDKLALICDNEKTYYLLNGIGSEYGAFTTTMIKLPTSTYFSVVSQLMNFDIRNSNEIKNPT